MRAQSGYLLSKGAKKDRPQKLSGEDVKRLKLLMEREMRLHD
jgi:hypothetical protein